LEERLPQVLPRRMYFDNKGKGPLFSTKLVGKMRGLSLVGRKVGHVGRKDWRRLKTVSAMGLGFSRQNTCIF